MPDDGRLLVPDGKSLDVHRVLPGRALSAQTRELSRFKKNNSILE